MNFPKPKIVVSRCLEFDNVRYNGQVMPSQIVKDLMPYVEFVKVCPEFEIGLGVPREPIRIVKVNGENRLIQHKTEKDVTNDMNNFVDKFVKDLNEVDGFILKSKSPTMGVKNIKVYSGLNSPNVVERCGGFFGGKIKEKFSGYPIEEDDRLRNKKIRDHFLIQIYLFANLRKSKNTNQLNDFHHNNKLLFRFYNNNLAKKLNPNTIDYFNNIKEILSKPPQPKQIVEFFNNLSNKINNKERFLGLIKDYEKNKVSYETIKKVLEFELSDNEMLSQTFFNPFPKELKPDAEENREKDYW